MRLPIFWRVILAQISLIALILLVSLYALSHLYQLTNLTTAILSRDSISIDEEKRLLKLFFTQMRNAEKYFHLQDAVYYTRFTEGTQEFRSTLEKIASLLESPAEHDPLRQIQELHSRYVTALDPSLLPNNVSNTVRTELSDGIAAGINGLIRLREEGIARKTADARDRGAFAARVVGWLDESRRRLQGDLRTQETTIRSLREQINRSREIDLEMEKKERELSR